MTAKNEIKKEAITVSKPNIDYGLLSKVMILLGLSAAVLGIVTAYSNTAFVIQEVTAGKMAPLSMIAFPFELNVLGGLLNLMFGVAIIALGKDVKNW